MNGKKIGDLTVNDGGGLFDSEGLCDSLINDLNNLLKQTVSGQYIVACSVATQMAQKLINLKKGIKADTDSLKENIETLKREKTMLNECVDNLTKKDGAANGNSN